MKKPNGREFKALLVLSIVLPVGLLTTLRLSGVLQGPITITETMTLEAIKWESQRPDRFTYVDETLTATYTNDEISSAFYVIIGIYEENSVSHSGADYITMGLKMNSTVNPNGFMEDVYVVLRKDSQQSLVSLIPGYLNFVNLSLIDLAQGEKNYGDAHIKLAGVDNPDKVYLSATTEWSFLTPNNQTHQLEIAYELTYFNGTVFKKVIQPFQLKIVGK